MLTHADGRVAVVIGAGVSGLTTALVLARRGWHVRVLADGFDRQTVSAVAGAVWEWPPSVCGRHHDETVMARSAVWALASYQRFARLAADPHSGVILRPAVFYFRHRIEEHPGEHDKMRQLKEHVPGFVHDPALIAAHDVNPTGLVDAYAYLAPTVDTDRYLKWLNHQALAAGIWISHRSVAGPLTAQQERLCDEFHVDVIVNCSGLGAFDLAEDTMLDPHRGALLRMMNDGTTMPRISAVHAIANDTGTDAQDMVFIVPRGQDHLLIGGLVEPGRWDTDLTPHDRPIRDMLARAVEFMPSLGDARPDSGDPLRVGLRPFRLGGARLEAEPGTRIVHNYGHGGAGVTLSWGCAEQVAEIAERIVSDGSTPPAMRHAAAVERP